MTTTRLFYARAILAYGRFQRGPEYEQALVAVMTAEDSTAHWNPCDTTLFLPGATPYNSFGPGGDEHVWNYPTALDGVHATVATMAQVNMRPWYDALKVSGKSALVICRAFAETPWGGEGDTLPFTIVTDWNDHERDYVADRSAIVSGPGPWPFQSNGDPTTELATPK